MELSTICIRGAREHNLRDVTLELPRNQLICLTGVSGSGKSSLAFDTLYAEGQRRYIESLSAYARQFLGTLAKPDVDQITGLSPAVAIQQKSTGWNPRSTVGTVTGIYDFLRVLYARAGRQHCPECGKLITAQTSESIVARILTLPAESKLLLLAPVVRGQKGEHVDLLEDLQRRGFVRARIDGQVYHLDRPPKLGRHNRHDIEVVIDRLTLGEGIRTRLTEAVESALEVGEGTLIVATVDDDTGPRAAGFIPADLSHDEGSPEGGRPEKRKSTSAGTSQDIRYTVAEKTGGDKPRRSRRDLVLSSKYACTDCGIGFEAPSPQLFSFNSPTGMCLNCDGIGTVHDFDPELLIPDPSLPFYAPCVAPHRHRPGRWRRHIYEGVARHVGFDINLPWDQLPAKARKALLDGTGDEHITFEWRHSGSVWKHGDKFEGVIAELKGKYRQAKASFVRRYYEKYMRHRECEVCGGARLNPQARAVRIGDKALHEVCGLSVRRAYEFFEAIELTPTETIIAAEVLKEVRARLDFLVNVGLDYLTLDRTAPTLSGGESQRIRLAGQIGSGLVGVLYVLDEPSIGLHPRDNKQLLASLRRLRDMGNTVVVVEHDEETMREADLIVDFGPGPGVRGGHVVAIGTIHDIAEAGGSITGAYLSGTRAIAIPQQRRPVDKQTAPPKAAVKQRGEAKKPPPANKSARLSTKVVASERTAAKKAKPATRRRGKQEKSK